MQGNARADRALPRGRAPRPKGAGIPSPYGSVRSAAEASRRRQGAADRFERLDRGLVRLLFRREAALAGRKRDAARRLGASLQRLADSRVRVLERSPRRPPLLTPERLILLVTHRCQLRCGYCRVRKFGMDMAEDVMERGVELLFTSPRPTLQLQFFGGEPLLRFDLVRKAVALAEAARRRANAAPEGGRHGAPATDAPIPGWTPRRETGKRVSYLLTTNGIALDAPVLRFLREHDFTVEFSCDGSMATQGGQRRPLSGRGGRKLHERVAANLEGLRSSGVPYYVIAVTTPESVGRLYDEFRHLAGLGHRRIQVNYCLGRLWPPAAVRKLLDGMDRILAFVEKRPDLEFVNATSVRREPVVLNAELTVDCDGGIYRETGICLEEDFARAKREFFVADVGEARSLERLGTSPFDNFRLLAGIYGRRSPAWRKVILNNIGLGWTVDDWVRRRT